MRTIETMLMVDTHFFTEVDYEGATTRAKCSRIEHISITHSCCYSTTFLLVADARTCQVGGDRDVNSVSAAPVAPSGSMTAGIPSSSSSSPQHQVQHHIYRVQSSVRADPCVFAPPVRLCEICGVDVQGFTSVRG
eukprot:scaffold106197_cov27-Prasinocladus_malaysianus.AAC.2